MNPATIVNALPHPVLVVDRDNGIVEANAAAEDFFAMSVPRLRLETLDNLVAPDSPLIGVLHQTRSNRAPINEYNVHLGTPKHTRARLVDIHAGPIVEHPDQLLVMIQQRSMAQMIERQLTHRAAARSISGLAAVLAHEIKNPLSGIRGAAQLLEPEQTEAGRALTQLICVETDRICNLVDRMEIFGDDRPPVREPVNVHAVLDRVVRLARNGFARGIEIEENYDPSLPPLSGDQDQLIQAILNLVKNAAEAVGGRKGSGRITLTTAYRPGVRLSLGGSQVKATLPLLLTIRDNGPGVPQDLQAHIFDPFVTTKSSGSGLGLALVAKIIRDHAGGIEFDSGGSGTEFRISLPLHTAGRGVATDPPAGQVEVVGDG